MTWTPSPDLLQPGADCDRVVAASQGVHRVTVTKYRRAHGIASGGRMGRPTGSGAWIPASGMVQPGEDSDERVAAAHGVPVSRVFRYRQRHVVAAYRRGA